MLQPKCLLAGWRALETSNPQPFPQQKKWALCLTIILTFWKGQSDSQHPLYVTIGQVSRGKNFSLYLSFFITYITVPVTFHR